MPARRSGNPGIVEFLGLLLFGCACLAVGVQTQMLRSLPGERVETDFGPHRGFQAFHDQVYFPVRALWTGENPFEETYPLSFHPDGRAFARRAADVSTDPAVREWLTPVSLFVHAPLGLLNLRAAEWVYLAISLLLALLIATLLFRFSHLQVGWGGPLLLAGVMILSRPGLINFYLMGIVPVLTLGVILALEYGRRNPLLAGWGVMLAACDLTFGLPVVVILLLRGHWRAALWGLFWTALAVGAIAFWLAGGPFWQAGTNPFGSHFDGWLSAAKEFQEMARPDRIDLAAAVLPWSEEWGWKPALFAVWVPVGCLLVMLGAHFVERRPEQRIGLVSRIGLLGTTGLVAAVFHVTPDAWVLWPALAALFLGAPAMRSGFPVMVQWIVSGLLLIPMFNFLGAEILMERLALDPDSVGWKIATSIDAAAIGLVFLILAAGSLFSRVPRSVPSDSLPTPRQPAV